MKRHQSSPPLRVHLLTVLVLLAWVATASPTVSSPGYYLMFNTIDCSDKGVKEVSFTEVDKNCKKGTIKAYKTVVQLPLGSEESGEDPNEDSDEDTDGDGPVCTQCNSGQSCSLASEDDGFSAPLGVGHTLPTPRRLQSAFIVGDLVATNPHPLLDRARVTTYISSFIELQGRPQARCSHINYAFASPNLKQPVVRSTPYGQTHTNRLFQEEGYWVSFSIQNVDNRFSSI